MADPTDTTGSTDTSGGNFSLDSILSGDYLTQSSYLPSSSGDTTLPTLTTPYTAPYTPTTSTSGTFDPGFDPATFATSGAAQTATNTLYNSLYGTGGTLSGATGTGTAGGTTTGGGAAANPFGGLLSSALNYGVPLAWAADQKATNAKNIQPLKDIGTNLTAQGQEMLKNYQSLSPAQQQALDSAIKAGQTTAGRGSPLIDIGNEAFKQYQAGNLPAWQQAELDQKVAQQKALARQSLGANVDSTTLAQMDAQIDSQAQIAKGQMISANLATGESAYGQGVGYETTGNTAVAQAYRSAVTDINTNLSNSLSVIGAGLGPLESAIQMQIAGDTAITNSLTQMYSALAKAAGTAAAGNGAAGGGAGGAAGGLGNILSSLTGGGTTTGTTAGGGGVNPLTAATGAVSQAKNLQNLYNKYFGGPSFDPNQAANLDTQGMQSLLQNVDPSALFAAGGPALAQFLSSLPGYQAPGSVGASIVAEELPAADASTATSATPSSSFGGGSLAPAVASAIPTAASLFGAGSPMASIGLESLTGESLLGGGTSAATQAAGQGATQAASQAASTGGSAAGSIGADLLQAAPILSFLSMFASPLWSEQAVTGSMISPLHYMTPEQLKQWQDSQIAAQKTAPVITSDGTDALATTGLGAAGFNPPG